MRLREFAPAGGGGSGDYFQALASAWYNGTFDSGSLQKGIKSQQDVERLLNRGIVCPDGKTRKLHIDYNSDFDGVEIYSDDYYEHGDESGELDSRTGQKWGPYDFMAFSDEDLSEGLNEFAADDGDSGSEDDALRNYAKMWWAGDEATQMQIEKVLARMGWEIGEDEGSYDNGGVFVVRAGDENGNSYQSWTAEDLTEGVAEGSLEEDEYDKMLRDLLKARPDLTKKYAKDVQKSKDIESGKELNKLVKKNPGVLKTYSDAVKRDKKLGVAEGWKTSAAVGAGLGGLAGGMPGAAVGALGGIAHNQWSNLIKKSKHQAELKKQQAELKRQQAELKRQQEDPETKEFVEVYNKWMKYFYDLWDHQDRKLEASGISPGGVFRLYQIYKEKIEQDVWNASGTYEDRTNTLKNYIADFKKKLENTEPEMPTESVNQGVAEGHADQQRKIFKKNGHPVGEVGIDRESSPGNGQWYMKYYATGDDFGGYDSMEEAVADLKHLVNQFKAEGVAEGEDKYAELSKKIQDLAQAGKEGEANKLRYELNRLLMLDRDKKRRKERGVAEGSEEYCDACDRVITKKPHVCPGEQGVAEGSDPWGPQGRFVGDTGPTQVSTTVPRVQLRIGDRVVYKPTEQRATIEALSKDGTKARIHIPSPMGGKIFNCQVADLKALGALKEKSTSQAQFRTMAAAAHNPKFAKKVGIKQSVAREFNKADRGQSYKSLPKKAD